MKTSSDPDQPTPGDFESARLAATKAKRRKITVTLSSKVASIVERYKTERGISKTRAIEELILLNR
jgi:hypothetical protein